jgi:NAD(P)-dependent dehydrogenase (short-subunit alcohol dehydrogenase family)
MTEISFAGQVAIVTGAGGGLGRTHALDLARRGAKVVVNDLGGDIRGENGATTPADQVVAEIAGAGGEAVANYDSVATPDGGAAIVEAALSRWGRIDALVNNAGNIRNGPFTSLTPGAVDALLSVHVKGAFNVTQPAFEAMRAAGYGRIVFTSSSAGIFGSMEQANYAAAKTAMIGLANVVALEGQPHGILANTILPYSPSRMRADMSEAYLGFLKDMPTTSAHSEPEMVSAMVTYLASNANVYSKEIFSVARGRFGRVFLGVTPGWHVGADEPVATAEGIAAHIELIRDQTGYAVPDSMLDEFKLVP